MILNRVNKTNTAKIVNRVTANINNTTAERVNNSITEQWVNHPINKTSKKGKACPPDNRLDFLVEANLKREPISNANNLKKGSRHIGYTLWRKGLNGLRFDSQYLEWVCQEGEKRWSINACLYSYHSLSLSCFLSGLSFFSLLFFHVFLCFLFFLLLFFLLPPSPLFIVHGYPLFITSAIVGFTLFVPKLFLAPYRYPSRTTH